MRRSRIGAMALMAYALTMDTEYHYSDHRSQGGQNMTKSTLKQSEQAKRKSKNKSAKKARKQNRK